MLPQVEQLPAEKQEELAAYIEALIEEVDRKRTVRGPYRSDTIKRPLLVQVSDWVDPFGACSDLPDTILEDLDQLRHSSLPTPPIELP
jgi:hypothetical protein